MLSFSNYWDFFWHNMYWELRSCAPGNVCICVLSSFCWCKGYSILESCLNEIMLGFMARMTLALGISSACVFVYLDFRCLTSNLCF